jgi:hypothetical protein
MSTGIPHGDPSAGEAQHVGGGHDHDRRDGPARDDHDDHRAHPEQAEPLGPIDRAAWGAMLLGVLITLLVAGSLYLSATS